MNGLPVCSVSQVKTLAHGFSDMEKAMRFSSAALADFGGSAFLPAWARVTPETQPAATTRATPNQKRRIRVAVRALTNRRSPSAATARMALSCFGTCLRFFWLIWHDLVGQAVCLEVR
jgi:hypothetical protein